jgi:two-component system cell cycle sensor histidine kinase/response regulator CckA
MDDEESIRQLMVDMIEHLGSKVDSAAGGKQALEKYMTATNSTRPFDIVIMDLTIPVGMGGEIVIKKLLEMHKTAKVIVSSDYSTDPVMANYTDYGFKGRLVKPFKIRELIKELTRTIKLE